MTHSFPRGRSSDVDAPEVLSEAAGSGDVGVAQRIADIERLQQAQRVDAHIQRGVRADVLPVQGVLDHQPAVVGTVERSEEHTSELQSLMRTSYAVFCLKKKKTDSHLTQIDCAH